MPTDDLKTRIQRLAQQQQQQQPVPTPMEINKGPLGDSTSAPLYDSRGQQINHASPGEQQMLNEHIPLQLYDQTGQELAAKNSHLSGPALRELVIQETRRRMQAMKTQQQMSVPQQPQQ